MKNLWKMSLLALFIAGGVACEEDKTNSPAPTPEATTKKKVEGDWKMTENNQEIITKTNGQVFMTVNVTGNNFNGIVSFKADESIKSTVTYTATTITSSLVFGTDTAVVPNASVFDDGITWKIDANGDMELSATVNGQVQINTFEIVSLTAQKMVLRMERTETQSQGGATATVEHTSNLSFEK